MPSRKQRRRREKDRRHDYEYVYVDEEGRELAVEDVEPEVAQQNGAGKKREATGGSRTGSKQKASQQRGKGNVREVQPPSWPRVLKRAGVFAPFMFASIYLIDRNLGLPGTLLVTTQMLAVFIPFSYLMDRTLYRRFLRHSGSTAPGKTARRS
jgi:hypothetical protein